MKIISYNLHLFPAASLDIVLSFNAWRSLKITQVMRYLLKFVVAAFWVVVLPICYSSSVQSPTGLVKFFRSWAGDWSNHSLYDYAVAIYLLPNILAALLFVLPPLRRTMERSNMRITTFVMWWAQVSMPSIIVFTFLFVSLLLLQWVCILFENAGSLCIAIVNIKLFVKLYKTNF